MKSKNFNDSADKECLIIFLKKHGYKAGRAIRMEHYLEMAGRLYEETARPYAMCIKFVEYVLDEMGIAYT